MLDPRLSDADLYPLKLRDLIVHPLDQTMAPEKIIWCGDNEHVIQDLECVGLSGDRYHRGFLPGGDKTAHLPYTGTVMAVDPAGRGADETAYAIVSICNGMLYLRDSGAVKGYEDPELEKLAKQAKQYKVNTVICEPNFAGGLFTKSLARVMAGIYPCSVLDGKWSTGNKEKRILDALEPVLTAHRLVVDRAVIKRDYDSTAVLGEVGRQIKCRLFYQLSRLTRRPGCLDHDDRVEALAMAVRYWGDALGTDPDRAAERSRERALKEALKHHCKTAIGGDGRRNRNWARPLG